MKKPCPRRLLAPLLVLLGVFLGLGESASGKIDLRSEITDSGIFLSGPSRVGQIEQTSLNPRLAKRASPTNGASDLSDWLSRDPLGEDETLNLYAYCHADPINKVDVLGAAELDISDVRVQLIEGGGGAYRVLIPVREWRQGGRGSNGRGRKNSPAYRPPYRATLGYFTAGFTYKPSLNNLDFVITDAVAKWNFDEELRAWDRAIDRTKMVANFLPGGRAGVLGAEGNWGGAVLSFGTDGVLTFTGGKWIKNANSTAGKFVRGAVGGAGAGVASEASMIGAEVIGGAEVDPYQMFIRVRNAAGAGAATGLFFAKFARLNGETPGSPAPNRLPHFVSQGQFDEASALLRASGLSDDIVIQGSRVSGTSFKTGKAVTPGSDIDIAIMLNEKAFNQQIIKAFGTKKFGTADGRTMLHAIDNGKITSGRAGLRSLRKELEGVFGTKVDLSIIQRGGKFDNGAQLPIR